jgi:hypothetical protein
VTDQLFAILEPIALRVFADLAREFAHEDFYSVALLTTGDYRYVADCTSTMQGLKRVAQRYLRKRDYRRRWRTLSTAMRQLKWNPGDSPYYALKSRRFRRADTEILRIWRSGATYDANATAIHGALIRVMQSVRDARLFPTGVVFNVVMGDQSDRECLSNARLLNSRATLARFRAELRESGTL